jgi:hypothetical protein
MTVQSDGNYRAGKGQTLSALFASGVRRPPIYPVLGKHMIETTAH